MRVREATPDDAALLAELWLALARENLPYSPLNELVEIRPESSCEQAPQLASESAFRRCWPAPHVELPIGEHAAFVELRQSNVRTATHLR